eukprot:TRINITY_DN3208_c0_g1_i12.p1 TRINITY_DN3208_c0_g1~~TRINITY_DN3208_c0_g1_i12.p1  ORF type:complete len:531 (-),score=95.18 TRINITY_DN3208_c0_g1_i12:324-1916(-)
MAIEVRRLYRTECVDGAEFLERICEEIKKGENPDVFASLLEHYGYKIGSFVAGASVTHLDIRPSNTLVNVPADQLDRLVQEHRTTNLEVSLIDWANCMLERLSENLEKFKQAVYDFEMAIVDCCLDVSFEEMKSVIRNVYYGFIKGVMQVEYLEIPSMRSSLEKWNLYKDGLEKSEGKQLSYEFDLNVGNKWEYYHMILKSDILSRYHTSELKRKSFEWGLCSSKRNPMVGNTENEARKEQKELLKEEMNELASKIDFTKDLLQYAKVINEDEEVDLKFSRYHKFAFRHSANYGSRWVFSHCFKKNLQVVEYNKRDRIVTVLAHRKTVRSQIIATGTIRTIEMNVDAFKPPKFENSPLNLNNCYVPNHYPGGKSLFDLSEDELYRTIENKDENEAKLRQEIKNQAKREANLRQEIKNQAKREAKLRQEIKNQAKREAKLRQEIKNQAKREANKREAKLRQEIKNQAKREANKREAKLRQEIKMKNQENARLKFELKQQKVHKSDSDKAMAGFWTSPDGKVKVTASKAFKE